MSHSTTSSDASPRVGPPTKHQLAAMIWLAVFPTLTVLNLALGSWLESMGPVTRTFVLATLAVPIVIYGLNAAAAPASGAAPRTGCLTLP